MVIFYDLHLTGGHYISEYIRLRNKMTQSEWENSFEKEEREIIILRHEGGGGSY